MIDGYKLAKSIHPMPFLYIPDIHGNTNAPSNPAKLCRYLRYDLNTSPPILCLANATHDPIR